MHYDALCALRSTFTPRDSTRAMLLIAHIRSDSTKSTFALNQDVVMFGGNIFSSRGRYVFKFEDNRLNMQRAYRRLRIELSQITFFKYFEIKDSCSVHCKSL